LWTRARALERLGRKHEAIIDLRQAVELARRLKDPAMFLRVATILLQMDGDDALLQEARSTASRDLAALPDGQLRERFQDAEVVHGLGPIA